MKVLLIDPPAEKFSGFYRYYFPAGLAYLAAVLERAGHRALILDADHLPTGTTMDPIDFAREYHRYQEALANDDHEEWRNIRRFVTDFGPDLVGIYGISIKVPSALKVAGIVKGIDPAIKVVIGGEHATSAPRDFLFSEFVDFVVQGEGERTLLDLVDALENGAAVGPILGLCSKANGVLRLAEPRPLIDDLDSLPFPARHLLHDLSSYRPIDLGMIIDARGCPYHCTFCSLANTWGRGVRIRSIPNVLDEVATTATQFGVKYFSFRNGTFTLNKKRVLNFWLSSTFSGSLAAAA